MRHEKSLSPLARSREWHLPANSLDGEQASELSGNSHSLRQGLVHPRRARVAGNWRLSNAPAPMLKSALAVRQGSRGRKAPMPLFSSVRTIWKPGIGFCSFLKITLSASNLEGCEIEMGEGQGQQRATKFLYRPRLFFSFQH